MMIAELEKSVKDFSQKVNLSEHQDILFMLLFLRYAGHSGNQIITLPKQAKWRELRKKAGRAGFAAVLNSALKETGKSNPNVDGFLGLEDFKLDIDGSGEILGLIFEFVDSLDISSLKGIDLYGGIYEYLNVTAAGRGRGVFFTPDCVARMLVEMIQPSEGSVYDPCCGIGGMLVHAANYAQGAGGGKRSITVFGQESGRIPLNLCRLNLALRGMAPSKIGFDPAGTLKKNIHPGLEFDFILANPPFNQKNWGGKELKDDPRWFLGRPPESNGNFAWVQHCLGLLRSGGIAGIALPNGSLTSSLKQEAPIREELAVNNFVDCIVSLPDKLFANTGISACTWILNNEPGTRNPRGRRGEILFIDARHMGRMVTRRQRILLPGEIAHIASIYKGWRGKYIGYEDIPGLCRSVPPEEVAGQGYVLTPSRYLEVKAREIESDADFHTELKGLYTEYKDLAGRGLEIDIEISQRLSMLTGGGKK